MKYLVLLLIIASLLAVPVASAWTTTPELRTAASQLAGRDVGVRCVSNREASYRNIWGAGLVDAPGKSDYMWLYAFLCDGVKSLLRGEAGAEYEPYQADGLMTLIHEAGHLRGIVDEGRAQRYALRNFRKAAIRFGASPAAASRMLGYAIEAHMTLPGYFHAPGCRRPSVGPDGHLRGCK